MEKGSILVLTLVGVLVLSLLATGLLTVGTTEINTTRNFHLNKFAYYTAVQGVEEIRNEIYNTPNVEVVETISKSSYDTLLETDGVKRSYITGSLYNLQENDPRNLTKSESFKAPPLPGMQLNSSLKIGSVMWRVNVSSEVTMGKRKGFSEITAGILSIIESGYN